MGVFEGLNSQADPIESHLANGCEVIFGCRPWITLDGPLSVFFDFKCLGKGSDQLLEFRNRQFRWSSPSQEHRCGRASPPGGASNLFLEGFQVHLAGLCTQGPGGEVAVVAFADTKGDMNVEAQGDFGFSFFRSFVLSFFRAFGRSCRHNFMPFQKGVPL